MVAFLTDQSIAFADPLGVLEHCLRSVLGFEAATGAFLDQSIRGSQRAEILSEVGSTFRFSVEVLMVAGGDRAVTVIDRYYTEVVPAIGQDFLRGLITQGTANCKLPGTENYDCMRYAELLAQIGSELRQACMEDFRKVKL
jgi:hypothetical protein